MYILLAEHTLGNDLMNEHYKKHGERVSEQERYEEGATVSWRWGGGKAWRKKTVVGAYANCSNDNGVCVCAQSLLWLVRSGRDSVWRLATRHLPQPTYLGENDLIKLVLYMAELTTIMRSSL